MSEKEKKENENTTDIDNNIDEVVENENNESTEDVIDTEAEEKEEEEVEKELSPIDELQEKYNALNDKYLRLYSDFENFRKRTIKEKSALITNASADVIKDILAVVDDFERAVQNNQKAEDVDGLKQGFELIHNKFKKILENKGVKLMEAKGEPFNYDLHEAITKIPAPSKKEKGKVIDVVEQGYYLNDQVLRFAKVVVGE